jgi:hypothetical protein
VKKFDAETYWQLSLEPGQIIKLTGREFSDYVNGGWIEREGFWSGQVSSRVDGGFPSNCVAPVQQQVMAADCLYSAMSVPFSVNCSIVLGLHARQITDAFPCLRANHCLLLPMGNRERVQPNAWDRQCCVIAGANAA